MSFTEKELEKIHQELNTFIETRRPPEDIRNQVDLSYKFEKNTVLIYETRKMFMKEAMVDIPIAKASYVIKDGIWKIYWQKADLKWHIYEPKKDVKTIKAFIKIVDEDQYGCFWG